MRFSDELTIQVQAGHGGHGCVSFRREKYIPMGGPDGGNGGNGGSVYLVVRPGMNALTELRHHALYRADSGASGSGKNRTGSSGKDLSLPVPSGTRVFDADTAECIGELLHPGASLCVAQGGRHGTGNAHFKSSTNRAPRTATKGQPGECRALRLELNLLADVGLLGLPNVGKSRLIRAISSAKPKVSDYPFTTLKPQLGVVTVDEAFDFIVADIPGLIHGASQGAGLGVQFLKHLNRCGLLLHLVDLSTIDVENPSQAVDVVQQELMAFSAQLAQKPQWLVFSKRDLCTEAEARDRAQAVLKALNWEQEHFMISSHLDLGLKPLCYQIKALLTNQRL